MIRKLFLTVLSLFLLLSCTAAKNKSNNSLFLNKKAEQKYIEAYNNTMKLWPIPYVERDIPTTFGLAHVIISGPADGEPMVLLHGMDASSTMWYPNIKDFAKKYRIYAIDYLVEPGKSIANEEKFTGDDITAWYNQIFDELKLTNINLVGTSRGGWVATHYTIDSQDRIKKLVLLAPVQTFSGINMQSETMTAASFKFFPNRKRLKKVVNSFSRKPGTVCDEFKEQMYLGTKNSKSNFDLLQMKPFSDDELKMLTLPVMVLVGDHDILNKPDIVATAGSILPNVNAAVIEDAGHFLTIDQREEVDKRIMEFLQEK